MEKTWGTFPIESGHDRSISIGDLEARVVGVEDGFRIHIDGRALLTTPELPGWRNISLPAGHDLRFRPRTPDLPVVLRADEPVVIAVDGELAFEVLLPLWWELGHVDSRVRRDTSGVLFDLPSKSLKRSWFGTPESGEVAYSWRFNPRSRRAYQRHLLTVPVTIVNKSATILRFERFLLRAVNLGVYKRGAHLATNGVTVAFKGSEQLSQIIFESHEKMVKQGNELLGPPREQGGNDMIRKSFGWLRDLAV